MKYKVKWISVHLLLLTTWVTFCTCTFCYFLFDYDYAARMSMGQTGYILYIQYQLARMWCSFPAVPNCVSGSCRHFPPIKFCPSAALQILRHKLKKTYMHLRYLVLWQLLTNLKLLAMQEATLIFLAQKQNIIFSAIWFLTLLSCWPPSVLVALTTPPPFNFSVSFSLSPWVVKWAAQ